MRRLSKSFYLFFFIIHLIFIYEGTAQKNKGQLEKEKTSVQNQIKEAQQILAQTSKKKKARRHLCQLWFF